MGCADSISWFVRRFELSDPLVPPLASDHHGRNWYIVLVDDVHKSVFAVVFVIRGMLTRFSPSVGGFSRWSFCRVHLTDDRICILFHSDEVVRASDSVLKRRGWVLV